MLAIISTPPSADEVKPYPLPRDKRNMDACKLIALQAHPGSVRSVRPQSYPDSFRYRFEITGNDGPTWIVVCEAETRQIVADQPVP